MLPDGHNPNSHLRLSLVFRSMLYFYGGTITMLHVRRPDQYPVVELSFFLGRQSSLKWVLPKLAPSIEQGCLCHVQELTVEVQFNKDYTWDLDEE